MRFEVTLRLGNATLIMASDNDNEDGKKKLNPHFTALLEKYVSIFIASAFVIFLYFYDSCGACCNSLEAQPIFPFSLLLLSFFCVYCYVDAFIAPRLLSRMRIFLYTRSWWFVENSSEKV